MGSHYALADLCAQVDEFHVIIGLKDRIKAMLGEAYDLGYEQANADKYGVTP